MYAWRFASEGLAIGDKKYDPFLSFMQVEGIVSAPTPYAGLLYELECSHRVSIRTTVAFLNSSNEFYRDTSERDTKNAVVHASA